MISNATVHIIGLTKIAKIEFVDLPFYLDNDSMYKYLFPTRLIAHICPLAIPSTLSPPLSLPTTPGSIRSGDWI